MSRNRHTPEQIIGKLREAEVALAGGHAVLEVCRTLGITEQTYYRWRKEYGGSSGRTPVSGEPWPI
jgi:transposase-like protein